MPKIDFCYLWHFFISLIKFNLIKDRFDIKEVIC